ncbi:MAG: signal recognition particle-docking protein FtsY [bacterium]|nr:signal recognition particle-docking protein FtsY [bacterium]
MLLNRLKSLFKKAKLPLGLVLESAFKGGKAEDFDFIEEQLILADIGMETSGKIISELKKKAKEGIVIGKENLLELLREIIMNLLPSPVFPNDDVKPLVILVSGINGAGKTTTIGKLASMYEKKNKRVMMGACDTFRAAADEQLKVWAQRTNSLIYSSRDSKDPAAVAFETVREGLGQNCDVIIIDTAGRMHTNEGLMKEIEKIVSVLNSKYSSLNMFSILVMDANTGKNALCQAKQFKSAAKVNAIFLSKMDGTAKGGSVITVSDELKLPISYVGTGESIDDLSIFDKNEFVNDIV